MVTFHSKRSRSEILGLHASISPSSASLQITCPVVGPHRRGGPVVRSFTSRPAPPVAAAALYERVLLCVCDSDRWERRRQTRTRGFPRSPPAQVHRRHFDWELEILARNWQGSAAHPYIVIHDLYTF